MAGERDDFAKGLRAKARALVASFDPAALAGLRSELLALDAYLRTNPKAAAKARDALDRTLSLAEAANAFAAELGGFLSQKSHSELASLFDLGAIGVLGVENVLTADKPSLIRILMSSLSEGLMYLASRQYVAGSRDVLAALYREHAATMHRELWALATDHRKGMAAKDVREVQAALDGFFVRLEAPEVPPEVRVRILKEFFALVLLLRVGELLDAL